MDEVKLNLTPDDKKQLIEHYKRRRRQLIAELNMVDQNLAKLEVGSNILFNQQYNLRLPNYQAEWQWPQKIEFALSHINKCVTVREILTFLCEFEPKLKENPTSSAKISSAVSYQDNKMLKRYKIKELDKEYQVGLKDWFENETPKEEYRSKNG